MRILRSGGYDNILRMAFPVNILPEEQEALRGEGIHMITDPEFAEPNMMQGVKDRKKPIKELVGQLTLPRIIYPNPKHVIEIDGRQYYLVDIAQPQPKKNPEGTLYLMDIATGRPERKPFMQYADRIRQVRRERVMAVADEINAMITKWNAKIDNIKGTENLSTWPLQLASAMDVIDERLGTLRSMEQSLVASLDSATNLSPSYSGMVERMKQDVSAGRLSGEDLVDTIAFIWHYDPDSIPVLLESPNIPEADKAKFMGLQDISRQRHELDKSQRTYDDQTKQERINAPTDTSMLAPGEPLPNLKVDDARLDELGKKLRMSPDQYFSPSGKAKQIRAELISIRGARTELESVRAAIDGIRDYVAHLGKGERARDVLMNTEAGAETKRRVADFLHRATAFERKYKVDVFVTGDDGTKALNPALLGSTGGPGNAKVAIALNQVVSIVKSSLRAHAGQPQEEVPAIDFEGGGDDFTYLPQDSQ